MVEQQGAVRANVSLPRGLKARMDAVNEPVNWSAVAAQAFEAKLLELAARKEVGNVEDVIARLKAADELDIKEEYQQGCEAGGAWARETARPRQLRALARMAGGVRAFLIIFEDDTHEGIRCELFEQVNPREKLVMHSIDSFWAEALGDDQVSRIDDIDFAQGFVEGALALWKKVAHKV
jgi:hypothetical protein